MHDCLLGIDIGTTHLKGALFGESLQPLYQAERPMPVSRGPLGESRYDPEAVRTALAAVSRTLVEEAGLQSGTGRDAGLRPAAVGITGMAESGLLIGPEGKPAAPMIPWHDRSSANEGDFLRRRFSGLEFFAVRGIQPGYKTSVSKLLYLKNVTPEAIDRSVWLSASDYAVWLLTGTPATDRTLAVRTYAWRSDIADWDRAWLADIGLPGTIFPQIIPPFFPVGTITAAAGRETGLPPGIPVFNAGHDHVCASLGAAAAVPGRCLDSIGTAEALVGVMDEGPLTERHLASGFSFGPHLLPGRRCWMGGCSASGGSVEWLMDLLMPNHRSYAALSELLETDGHEPTGILYFPYLGGRSGPNKDPSAAGSFFGLRRTHGAAQLLRAVLEGTACEMETILERAQLLTGIDILELTAAGGGTKNDVWMQIRAAVHARTIRVPLIGDAALAGAALTAGIGCGLFPPFEEMVARLDARPVRVHEPERDLSVAYRTGTLAQYRAVQRLYEDGALRSFEAEG